MYGRILYIILYETYVPALAKRMHLPEYLYAAEFTMIAIPSAGTAGGPV